MASRTITMYAEKKMELEEIKNGIIAEFDKHTLMNIEFKNEVLRELGETKTLLLIFENWFFRTTSYASLVIMLSEFRGYLSADIISTGGKEDFCSWGVESDFAALGQDALRNLGFISKIG